MQKDRVVHVLDALKGFNHGFQVVAISNVAVVKAHGREGVGRGLPVAVAQGLQGYGQAADVLVDGPLVVVDYDDQVVGLNCRVVQAFKGYAPGHGAVNDQGHDVFLAAH